MHGTTQRLFARKKARFAELVARYCADCGGDASIPESVRAYIRRIAFIECTLQDLEQEYVTRGSITPRDRSEYAKLTTTQSKLMRAIGLINAKSDEDADDADDLDSIDIARPRPSTSRPHRERL